MPKPDPSQERWVTLPDGGQGPVVVLSPITGGHTVRTVPEQWAALLDQLSAIEAASANDPTAIVEAVASLETKLGFPSPQTLHVALNAIAAQLSATHTIAIAQRDELSALSDLEINGRESTHLIMGSMLVALQQIRDAIAGLGSVPSPGPSPTPTPTSFTPVTLNSGNAIFDTAATVPFSSATFLAIPAGATRIKVTATNTQYDALLTVAAEQRRVTGSTAPGDRTFYQADLACSIAAGASENVAQSWEIPVDGQQIRFSLQGISGGTAKLYGIAY